MCLYPRLIKNPKYRVNKRNGGHVPPVPDERVKMVPVGCQQCIECRKQKANWWRIRLNEEIRHDTTAKFMTLTFDTESLTELTTIVMEKQPKLNAYDRDNAIATLAMRRFLERWRKEYGKSVKHWFITEIGGGRYEHLHMHGFIWTTETKETINRIWKYGFTWAGDYVNESTINYTLKYMTKPDEKHKGYKPIILTSAGIGKKYMERTDKERNSFKEENTNTLYKTRSGIEQALPTYYRNKLYTEQEREKLWLHMLDKQERWVMGAKIDVSKSEEEYKKALKLAQQKNEKWGYGGNPNNWEEEQYERERLNLKRQERMEKRYKKNKKKKDN